tara:strand:- start:2326 stop:3474 length:1149 start_codon:yes stop_codon:yes gene_type:complete
MTRTLKRPMFRMGGSTGTGITSGLDQPRKQYENGKRVTQGLDPFIKDVRQAYSRNAAMPRQGSLAAGTLPGFLTSFGLNLASATPRGNIFQTAAISAQDPFKQFQTGVSQRASDRAAMNRAAINQAMTLKQSSDAADASMKKTQMLIDADIALVDQEHANEIEKINLEATLGTGDATTYAKKQAAEAYKATFSPELQRLNDLISDTEDPELRGQYESQKEGLLNKIIRGQQSIYLGQQTDVEFSRDVILKILQGAATAGELEDSEGISNIFNAISQIFPNYKEILGPDFKIPGQPMADGGRAGYNLGGMTNPMAATQAEAQTQDLSYSELRSRLPESINNDVVNILANSKQALLDFANIRDQQDVDEFNQRYNVSLTIPQEG